MEAPELPLCRHEQGRRSLCAVAVEEVVRLSDGIFIRSALACSVKVLCMYFISHGNALFQFCVKPITAPDLLVRQESLVGLLPWYRSSNVCPLHNSHPPPLLSRPLHLILETDAPDI